MSAGADVLFDPGAQPERTLLAWRRTTLALAVGSAAVVRFVTPQTGPLAVVVGLLGVCLCALAYLGSASRYRYVAGRLVEADGKDGDGSPSLPASPGAACAALAGALVVVGLGALSYVVTRALP